MMSLRKKVEEKSAITIAAVDFSKKQSQLYEVRN